MYTLLIAVTCSIGLICHTSTKSDGFLRPKLTWGFAVGGYPPRHPDLVLDRFVFGLIRGAFSFLVEVDYMLYAYINIHIKNDDDYIQYIAAIAHSTFSQ